MKKVFVIVMVCLMSVAAFAQEEPVRRPDGPRPDGPRPEARPEGRPEKGKRIDDKKAKEWMQQKKEQRRAYIVKEMGLTETETAAFNAIFDDYDKKISASRRKMDKAMKALNDSLSDADFTKNLDAVNAQKLEQSKITDDFYKAMKKALPIKKVYIYYKADKEFNKLMMRDMHRGKKKMKK